jgi:SAM-dependent methyltransferase
MGGAPGDALSSSYDRLADEYARRIFGELAHKPLDRALLDRFAGAVRGRGMVCDLGCGPGQVARYLRECGLVDVCGVDLSPGMIAEARRLTPGIDFRTGDLRALEVPDGAWAGIAAFYSILHVPRGPQLIAALREWRRVLQPDGRVLLSFHIGDEVHHVDELWGRPVSLDFVFFQSDEVRGYLEAAGLAVDEIVERDPYPDVEVATRRAYVFARRPP